MSAKQNPAKRSGVLVYALLGLFGLPFAIIGALADLEVIRFGYNDIRMHFWSEVPCNVLSAELEESKDSDSVTYRTKARYRYVVNGVEYVGTRVTVSESFDNLSHFHQRVHAELEDHRQTGKPFRCYVNSRQPEESILFRDGRWSVVAMTTWAGLIFSAVGFGLMGVVVASWIEERQKVPSASPPWQARSDWAAGEIRHSDRRIGRILLGTAMGFLVIGTPGAVTSIRELTRVATPGRRSA